MKIFKVSVILFALLVGALFGVLIGRSPSPLVGLTVVGFIGDQETRLPIQYSNIYLDGKLVERDVHRFAVFVPLGSEIRVTSPGYKDWGFRVTKLKEGIERMEGPVWLEPVELTY